MPKRKLEGNVISAKMQKTVVVAVDEVRRHPVYLKRVRSAKKYKAHDELGVKVGDRVRIEETRPLSREKRFKVVQILEKV